MSGAVAHINNLHYDAVYSLKQNKNDKFSLSTKSNNVTKDDYPVILDPKFDKFT